MAIEDLLPADTPQYMLPAWLGCISWALGEPAIVEAFRDDTGNRWKPGVSPLEQMVDQATGVDREFIETFVRWVNVNVWGPMEQPPFADAVDPVQSSSHEPSTRDKGF